MAPFLRSGKEKRSSTRIEISLSTSVMLVRVDSYLSGTIENISEGGCYFPVDQELPIGEKCLIDIVLGDGLDVDTVSLSGRIARNDSHGAGIEFVDNQPETTATLKKMLSNYSHPA
ncbi:MAG: PilZ domain-containing protein [Desulfocapsaceae bacterium]|jgi:hypothetical protein|nr:PilZ domain-containing protein [Desulfocapsaceae bacterium]